MTWNGRHPTRANRHEWTAWERAQDDASRATDFDACSCMTGPGIWPDYVSDIEDLTILSGLEPDDE